MDSWARTRKLFVIQALKSKWKSGVSIRKLIGLTEKKSSLNKLPARDNQRKETETAKLDESESHKTRGLMPIIGFLNGLGKRRLFF